MQGTGMQAPAQAPQAQQERAAPPSICRGLCRGEADGELNHAALLGPTISILQHAQVVEVSLRRALSPPFRAQSMQETHTTAIGLKIRRPEGSIMII